MCFNVLLCCSYMVHPTSDNCPFHSCVLGEKLLTGVRIKFTLFRRKPSRLSFENHLVLTLTGLTRFLLIVIKKGRFVYQTKVNSTLASTQRPEALSTQL